MTYICLCFCFARLSFGSRFEKQCEVVIVLCYFVLAATEKRTDVEDDKNETNGAQDPVPKATRARGRCVVFTILQDCTADSLAVCAYEVNPLFCNSVILVFLDN